MVIARLVRDEHGGVAATAAVGGMMLCAMAAISIDVAAIVLKARQTQGAADLAALSAAANLDQAQAAAVATVRDNSGADAGVELTLGRYAADRALSPASRFVQTDVVSQANAVRVEVRDAAPLYFGRWILGRDSVSVTRRATAALRDPRRPTAAFSIGTRLARVDGGAANALLSGLTGSEVSLSLMDYDALVDAEVDVLTFMDALATELDVTAADYDSLLDKSVDAGQALGVVESLLDGRAGSAIGALAEAATGQTLPLSQLLGGEAADIAGMTASVRALDLATAMLEVANGDRQVALDVGARAGLADLDVDLAIGERPHGSPWMTVTDHGEPIIRTAQARLSVRARTAQSLSGLSRIDLPILIEAAASEARLSDLNCEGARSVTLDVRPGIARAWIGVTDTGTLDDFKTPLQVRRATLLAVPLVSITGRADIEAADPSWRAIRFSGAEVAGGVTKRVATTGALEGAIGSLLGRLDFDVNVIGLGLGLGGLTQSLRHLLTPLGPVLDGVVNPVLDLLGVRLGEADVTLNGLRCPDERAAIPALVG